MATYPLPRVLEEIFNIENFLNTSYNTSYAEYAQLTLSNTFESINTFLSNVYIKATLFTTNLNASNINITNTFLGYNISTFTGIKAPIQAQFDSITTGDNITVQSTVSVAETITVSSEIPASVENIGTNINASLKFSIPQGKAGENAIQPSFSIGNVTSATTPLVTLTGSQTNPQLNFGLVSGAKGDTGPTGPTGEKGDPGSTPSFSIGNVISSDTPNASISYATTDIDHLFPILNLELEKGDTGSIGLTGERGERGE